MNKIIYLVIGCLLLSGCSQGPDFSKASQVIGKTVGADGIALYELDHKNGVRGAGWGAVMMKAPQDFAQVGEILEMKDGVLISSKKTDNN